MNRQLEIKKIAREIKEAFSPQTLTNVYEICQKLEIKIIEKSIKADAYLLCKNGKSFIVLRETLVDNRKKFTIAHELGHFFLPWHSEFIFGCDILEMDYKKEYNPREAEANLFAAELLMPELHFKRMFNGTVNYQNASDMAKFFEVSFQAALSRCVEFAKEDYMVICSTERQIKWFKATDFFPLRITRKKVSFESCAEELFDKNEFLTKLVQEPSYVWFDSVDSIMIEEESTFFPNYQEVISIIHLVDK